MERKPVRVFQRRLCPYMLAALTVGMFALGGVLFDAHSEANGNMRIAANDMIVAADDVYGGKSEEDGGASAATATASRKSLVLSDDASWKRVYGGYAYAVSASTAVNAARAAADENVLSLKRGAYENLVYGGWASAYGANASASTANGNMTNLSGGVYEANIYGAYAYAQGTAANAVAENNAINISGGIYKGAILAGCADTEGSETMATVRNNTITLTGTPNLAEARLYGYDIYGTKKNIAGNMLVIDRTKGLSTARVADFQRYVFQIPSGMTESDTMLTVTYGRDTDLSGAEVEAHVPGSGVSANRLRLLYAEKGEIVTDAATKLTVYEGISGTNAASIGVTRNRKELIVKRDGTAIDGTGTPRPDRFTLNNENAKSLVETMAGSVAFLGAASDLLVDTGFANAVTETANVRGFTTFAAINGSFMRYETGSHVDVKGMNLAVGFSREVTNGADRFIFGPVIEYGRGTYDSYVGAVHGDGSLHYFGVGAFMRQEKGGGMFYEASLRSGRSAMEYGADIAAGSGMLHPTYDTHAGYIGAHLGIGQRIRQADGIERETYLRYFYTHQNGTSVRLSTGDRYDFHAVDSHRLRTGARWTFPQRGGVLLLGVSLQYEFKGDACAAYRRAGGFSYNSPTPSLKGFSGSLEVGWKQQLSEISTLDLSLEGRLGRQRGAILSAGVNWKF